MFWRMDDFSAAPGTPESFQSLGHLIYGYEYALRVVRQRPLVSIALQSNVHT